MVYRQGEECLVVDAGLMFPGAEHLGVDVVVPDLSFLEDCGTIHGLVLTHGHEDHIGATPFLLARHDVPVYATALTRGLVQRRLSQHGFDEAPLRALPHNGQPLRVGPFAVEAIPVAHSIPQSVMLAIHTDAGTVVHTADFKFDPLPLDGVGADLARRLEALGRRGVRVVLSDSTNAEEPGFTPGERTVAPVLERCIAEAPARVLVTTFASNIHRIQQVADIAQRLGRRVCLVGASMVAHAEVAERLGLLRLPAGLRVDPERAMNLPRREVLLLVTGSQGEPLSALARIAVERHPEIAIEPGDRVIHSARIIPGNERSIFRMVDHLLRLGAEVITPRQAPVHVSGHPSREELRLVINLLRPQALVPIHGEFRHLKAHADLARQAGLPAERVILAESGDRIAVDEAGARIAGRVPAGQVFLDGGLEEVDLDVLHDRRRIAGQGVLVAVVGLARDRGADSIELVSRGFLPEADEPHVLEEARQVLQRWLQEASEEERLDEAWLKARVQRELKRFLKRRGVPRPLILPVIVEL